jgi:DNA helicase-2/ATP-dependent DNA helicase PcrA
MKEEELPKKKRGRKKKIVEPAQIMSGFIPSKYQQDIFDFIQHGNGNSVINALAGSGKTSTIVNAVKLIPSTCNALFIAFNKEIVKELEKKLAGVKNVQVKTLHSLGLLMIRRNLGTNIEIDEYKYRTFIKKNIKQLSSADFDKMTTKLIQQYTDNVIQLCDLGRYNLAQCEKDLLQVSARHDIPIIDDECNAVLNVMKWGRENTTSIDFTDMVWLPYELTLNPIGLQYDYIFIDECQDLNAAQRELFLRCFRRGTRFIAVGDKKQAIYSFAGADAESFAKLQNLPNTTTLPLPISYRCPKKVVNLANQFVDTMECREGAPDGEIVHNVSIKDIHDGDMVLCRTKMPLIKLYMRYLRMGVKSYVRGQDIGLNLLRMVDKTEQIVLNVSLQKDGVFARLYDDLFEERNRLMIKRGMDLEDATLSNQIMNKYDSIKALEILAEGLTSARDLHDRIENVFAESADGVCLSTIHKAKGLEANNVYILCKTLMPSRLATQDWEKEQEQNLMYVAYTRAKYKLGFVSETEISPSAGMIDPSAALTELNYIENKICKLLNKTPQVIMDATEVAQYNLKSATIIEEKETNHAEISSNNNEDSDSETMKKLLELVKKKGGIEKFEKFLEQ